MSLNEINLNQSIATEILTLPLEELSDELPSFKKNKIELQGTISSDIFINNDYFTKEILNNKIEIPIDTNIISQSNNYIELENLISKLKDENEELKKNNYKLENENEHLTNRIKELFKMLNDLLKIQSNDLDTNNENYINEHYSEIKKKITTMFYREIRLKHVFPFTNYVTPFGLTAFHHLSKNKTIINPQKVISNNLDESLMNKDE